MRVCMCVSGCGCATDNNTTILPKKDRHNFFSYMYDNDSPTVVGSLFLSLSGVPFNYFILNNDQTLSQFACIMISIETTLVKEAMVKKNFCQQQDCLFLVDFSTSFRWIETNSLTALQFLVTNLN